jgi:hypothetical protein
MGKIVYYTGIMIFKSDSTEKINKSHTLESNHIQLEAVDKTQIEQIRVWRNKQISVLRQDTLISKEEQIEYFERFVFPEYSSKEPKQILLSIKRGKNFIGYGGMVNINWQTQESEISFLLSPELSEKKEQYSTIFSEFLNLIIHLASQKSIKKLFTETFDFRVHHIGILEKAGFNQKEKLLNRKIVDNQMINSIIHERQIVQGASK